MTNFRDETLHGLRFLQAPLWRHPVRGGGFDLNFWAAPHSPDTLDGNMCLGESDANPQEVHG